MWDEWLLGESRVRSGHGLEDAELSDDAGLVCGFAVTRVVELEGFRLFNRLEFWAGCGCIFIGR